MNLQPSSPLDPLAALAAVCRSHGRPDRFHARAVLLWIGERLLAGESEAAARAVEYARQVTAPQGQVWTRAVQEELTLACTEHVRSVDPRYLGRPDYDLNYVVDARVDLQARLEAAEALGIEVPAGLLPRVMAADRLLEPALRARPLPDSGLQGGLPWARPGNASS